MLPAPNRLPKEEISRILRHGIRVRTDDIEFVYTKTTGTPRFAFIVSTKIDKRATARNRMRRIMSESVRHLLAGAGAVDGIFIAKKNFEELAQTEVETMIKRLLRP